MSENTFSNTQYSIAAIPIGDRDPRPNQNILANEEEPLLYRTQEEARFKVRELKSLLLSPEPKYDFSFHRYNPDDISNSYISAEEVIERQKTPFFSADNFEMGRQTYWNTGGQCMVADNEIHLPELGRPVWVNISDEMVAITSVDYIDQDDNAQGGTHEYKDVCLVEYWMAHPLSDEGKRWWPMIDKSMEYWVEQECRRYGCTTLPPQWAPDTLLKKMDPQMVQDALSKNVPMSFTKDDGGGLTVDVPELYLGSGDDRAAQSKLVYIASPYSGDVENNVAFAKDACRYCIDQGYTPIAVHLLYPQMLDDSNPAEREIGLGLGLQVLERCDELWVCGDRISEGMKREVDYAIDKGIPVFSCDDQSILHHQEGREELQPDLGLQ